MQKHHVLAIAIFTYMTLFTLAEKNPDIILASPKNESLKKVKIGGFKRTHDFLAYIVMATNRQLPTMNLFIFVFQ